MRNFRSNILHGRNNYVGPEEARMAEKQKYLDNAEFYGELLKWRDSHRDPA